MHDTVDFILDSEAATGKALFVVNSFKHNQLCPTDTIPSALLPRTSIPVQRHRHKATGRYTLHSYKDVLPAVQRLASSTWPNNYQLHEVDTHFLRQASPQRGLALVHAKLSRWTPRSQIQLMDSGRWIQLWSTAQAVKETCFLWKLLFNANAT